MRAVVQRVLNASVEADGRVVGAIDEPVPLAYLGITHTDGPDDVAWLAASLSALRVPRDESGAEDTGAPLLLVSRLTRGGVS